MSRLGEIIKLEQLPWKADEGSANLYYGKIRSGKTYGATADIVQEVRQGHLVYATWPIALECFDDRFDFFVSFRNLLFGQKIYYRIDSPKNFHYIDAVKGEVDGVSTFDPDDPKAFIEYLNSLNHCSIYIDEAWRVIDSYKGVNFGLEGRNLILVTGHQYRTINLIAQRPTSIHVTARANMNRFYRFEKILSWPVVRFRRTEFQDMAGETVDETAQPVSVKTYTARKAIFNAYNAYFYGALDPAHPTHVTAYQLKFSEQVRAFVGAVLSPLLGLMPKKRRRDAPNEAQ